MKRGEVDKASELARAGIREAKNCLIRVGSATDLDKMIEFTNMTPNHPLISDVVKFIAYDNERILHSNLARRLNATEF